MSVAILPTLTPEPEGPRIIAWQDPPVKNRRDAWAEVAEQLRQHPNQWALIGRDVPKNRANSIRQGLYKAFRPAGAFQARSTNINPSKSRADIYARYIGTKEN